MTFVQKCRIALLSVPLRLVVVGLDVLILGDEDHNLQFSMHTWDKIKRFPATKSLFIKRIKKTKRSHFFFSSSSSSLTVAYSVQNSYTDSNSVTGWDCTYCLFAWLSQAWSHELPTLYVPLPHRYHDHQYAEGMTERNGGKSVEEEERKAEAGGPLSVSLSYSVALSCNASRWPEGFLQKGKQERKLAGAGKVRISLGGNVQQQLRPGLSPALPPTPQPCIVLHTHTCIYIHSEHKAFTISGPPTYSNAWSRVWKSKWNVHWRMSPRLPKVCVLVLFYKCIYL